MTKDAQDPDVRALMERLRRWLATQERGRAARLARELGVKSTTLSDWLAHRTCPSLPKGLYIMRLLEREERQLDDT
jgi:hypothetical protein